MEKSVYDNKNNIIIRPPMTYGYARVSAKDQNPERQIVKLMNYGVSKNNIVIDKCTGVNFRRAGYNALFNALLQEGDTLVIPSVDRLGRNKKSTIREINKLNTRGINLIFIEDPSLNSDNINQDELEIKTYMAEQEYKKITQRSKEGMKAMPVDENGKKYSSKTGNYIGRPALEMPSNFGEICTLYINKEIHVDEAIEKSGVSKRTFYKFLNQYKQEHNIP